MLDMRERYKSEKHLDCHTCKHLQTPTVPPLPARPVVGMHQGRSARTWRPFNKHPFPLPSQNIIVKSDSRLPDGSRVMDEDGS